MTYKLPFRYKNVVLCDPDIQRFGEWSEANRAFFDRFRTWLIERSYSNSVLKMYGAATRTAIEFLRKEYWQIDPDCDLPRVVAHLEERPLSPQTRACYRKGLHKLDEYLHIVLHIPKKPKELRWENGIASLPEWLQGDVREFLRFCQRAWPEEKRFERGADLLYTISRPLSWWAKEFQLQDVLEITPQLWYAWLDKRLADGLSASTLNGELFSLKPFLYFLQDLGRPVCERFLLLDRLEINKRLPKDVPIDQLQHLQMYIQKQSVTGSGNQRRQGIMDLAWFLLMLHSGLRSGEIRFLKLSDIDWAEKRVRIEQSKRLKDRLVPMSEVTMQALNAYLKVRGPQKSLPENVFIFRDAPPSETYLFERMEFFGRRTGVGTIAPHRLRHSCATLLLNSGASVLAVQSILGHKQVDTTLEYARLYDGTVAADYYSAMNHIERQLALPEDSTKKAPSLGELIALTDALHRGTLNPEQSEIVRTLRDGLARLAACPGQQAREKEMAVV
ncbi:MAG TPA: tyrosine-type recombinase/integrase [Anaerolineales bacterium]|nr:tyrosine-type recombinase/integrase [Anaerolineales bacterium]